MESVPGPQDCNPQMIITNSLNKPSAKSPLARILDRALVHRKMCHPAALIAQVLQLAGATPASPVLDGEHATNKHFLSHSSKEIRQRNRPDPLRNLGVDHTRFPFPLSSSEFFCDLTICRSQRNCTTSWSASGDSQGGGVLLHVCGSPGPSSCSKMSLFSLKSCTPMKQNEVWVACRG